MSNWSDSSTCRFSCRTPELLPNALENSSFRGWELEPSAEVPTEPVCVSDTFNNCLENVVQHALSIAFMWQRAGKDVDVIILAAPGLTGASLGLQKGNSLLQLQLHSVIRMLFKYCDTSRPIWGGGEALWAREDQSLTAFNAKNDSSYNCSKMVRANLCRTQSSKSWSPTCLSTSCSWLCPLTRTRRW